jgi:hypothetical protein
VLMKTKVGEEIHYFDLIKGDEITNGIENGIVSFSEKICTRGIACFFSCTKTNIDDEFKNFLAKQKEMHKKASDNSAIPIKNIQLIRSKGISKQIKPPVGMKTVPGTSLTLSMEYTLKEIGGYGNVQDHLKLVSTHKMFGPCMISRKVDLRNFAIDETPVTNVQFKNFIDSSGYKPTFRENFLKHWVEGQIPLDKNDHPVVYVDLEDARAYAKWAGKRLLSEEEWQFAAQGVNALNYPWGNEMVSNKCNQSTDGKTSPVKAFPEGISPFGCYDMCGNTWEWTGNEYSDGRTRFTMLKGGSCYKALGSHWYTDGGPQKNNFIAKISLMWPGLDRCATIGFRCAIDL